MHGASTQNIKYKPRLFYFLIATYLPGLLGAKLNKRGAPKEEAKHVGHDVVDNHHHDWHNEPNHTYNQGVLKGGWFSLYSWLYKFYMCMALFNLPFLLFSRDKVSILQNLKLVTYWLSVLMHVSALFRHYYLEKYDKRSFFCADSLLQHIIFLWFRQCLF